MPVSPPAKSVALLDGLALCTSGLCLAHCLLLPLIIAVMPMASAALHMPEAFHLAALMLAVPVSGLTLLLGFRHHRSLRVLALGAGGVALLGVGVWIGGHGLAEGLFTVLGSMLLGWAHTRNWRLRAACCHVEAGEPVSITPPCDGSCARNH